MFQRFKPSDVQSGHHDAKADPEFSVKDGVQTVSGHRDQDKRSSDGDSRTTQVDGVTKTRSCEGMEWEVTATGADARSVRGAGE